MILPLSKAGLATVGLFIALGYWNNWYFASLYITREEMYPPAVSVVPVAFQRGISEKKRRLPASLQE